MGERCLNKHNLNLTREEIKAVQKLLGFVMYHTTEELYSVAGKLEKLSSPDQLDYKSVVFYKNSKDGSPNKEYDHRNFSIAIN